MSALNNNQQAILENLKQAEALLGAALRLLVQENKNGGQFDYCTNAGLSTLSTSVHNTATTIDKIVYQKAKL